MLRQTRTNTRTEIQGKTPAGPRAMIGSKKQVACEAKMEDCSPFFYAGNEGEGISRDAWR